MITVHMACDTKPAQRTLEALGEAARLAHYAIMDLHYFPLGRPWEPIHTAPIERKVEGWVKRADGEQYRLPFPIMMTRITTGHSEHGLWINAETDEVLAVYPSFWREWHDARR